MGHHVFCCHGNRLKKKEIKNTRKTHYSTSYINYIHMFFSFTEQTDCLFKRDDYYSVNILFNTSFGIPGESLKIYVDFFVLVFNKI